MDAKELLKQADIEAALAEYYARKAGSVTFSEGHPSYNLHVEAESFRRRAIALRAMAKAAQEQEPRSE